MLKVIDLDAQGKDSDGYVFTLSVGGDKVGVTDQELAEMIKARYAGGKGKRQGQKRVSPQDPSQPENGLGLGGLGDAEGAVDDPSH